MTNGATSVTRIEDLLREQEALRKVATLAASNPDPVALFECVCEEIGLLLDVPTTDMVRFEGGSSAVVVAAWSTAGSPQFPANVRIPIDGDTVTARLYASGKPERVDDYTRVTGRLAESLRAAGILSVVGAPIRVGGRLWGAIMASSPRPVAFPAGAEDRLAGFAELVTTALANVDAREELAASRARIVEAGYDERRRLGRELHEGAQQELVGAALSLQLADQRLDSSPAEARELVAAALEQVQAGLGDLRELAAGIHPNLLTDRGLSAALESLASRSPVVVELGDIPEERLPESVETTAYHVVAEALANAARHAECEIVEVDVHVDGAGAIVEVRDDGVGGARVGGGSSLRRVADRVSAFGGDLEVESRAGLGTTVYARLPVAP